MKKITLIFVALAAFSSLGFSEAPPYKPGEIIIRFKSDPTDSNPSATRTKTKFSSINEKHFKHRVKNQVHLFNEKNESKKKNQRLKDADEKYFSNIYILKLDKSADVENIVEDYRSDPNILYVEPNYFCKGVVTIPNDPGFAQQWGP